MRGSRSVTAESAQVEYIPADDTQPLDLSQLFPAEGPLEIDLGCGDGSFLVALAAEYPGRNFIGVERLLGRVRSACRKIAARQLPNARILRTDITRATTVLIPPASVAVGHLMFPDPWPKRRHHRRRTVTPVFLDAVHRILGEDGILRLTTDDAPYFEQMQRAAAAVPNFVDVAEDSALHVAQSTFEKRFVARGLSIYRLVLRKVSPGR